MISLPLLHVKEIKVKVDTGAATSALHAEDITYLQRHGKTRVRFVIYPKQKSKRPKIQAEADLLEMRKIRSSTGHLTERPVIITQLRLGEMTWDVEMTLVNRDIMGFRMLLGRKAIRKIFVVDPGRSFLISKKEKKS